MWKKRENTLKRDKIHKNDTVKSILASCIHSDAKQFQTVLIKFVYKNSR